MNEKEALDFHLNLRGKIEISSRVKNLNRETLSLAYTPGVAVPCLEIEKEPSKAYELTRKWNTVAVVSDGSAVLGLGNIGGLAGLPVMEGKAVLFKEFADIDAIPIVLSTQNTDEIVSTIKNMAITFGGINLEDISAPRCFEVEKRLKECLDIPVFHDDQHGTAIVVLAALINALKVVKKNVEDIKIVINGAGAAGTAICKLLLLYGAKNVIMNDKDGIINQANLSENDPRMEIAKLTNKEGLTGNLKDAICGRDVFIGVSVKKALTTEMVATMNKDAIIFAMANPEPEIFPEDAKAGGARIVGTGRSDFANQINNVLAFPGIFRGALDAKAKAITEEMKVATSIAIANLILEDELNEENIIPKPFDTRVAAAVASAVKKSANNK